jgi:hypothetical protein
MEYSNFTDSNIYLDILIEYQKQHNFFAHLTNIDEDIYKTIIRLYNEDDYHALFDPIYENIDDDSDIVYRHDSYGIRGNVIEIDFTWLNMIRTQNYFYCLIYGIGSIEENYALPWFKNKIKDLPSFNSGEKAKEYLFEKKGLNLDNYDEIEYDEMIDYYYGDLIFIDSENYTFNYIKKDAEIINRIEEDFEPLVFYEGLAPVYQNGKWGYKDEMYKTIIPFEFDNANDFSEGLASVVKDGNMGYIDKTGKTIIPFEYDNGNNFSEDLAAANKNGKWGFIDKTGRRIIPFEFDDVSDFGNEGLARVAKDWKWGFIDKTGSITIPFEYYFVSDFGNEDLARVKKDGKYGYIDKTGRIIIPFEYDDAWDFKEGLARVEKAGKSGFIDKTGRIIIPIEYDFVSGFNSEGLLMLYKDGKNRIVDKTGVEIIKE